jgi:DNA-binding response OmpR family regulator
MNARIMVVEDEEALTTLLRYNLDAEGYDVETVGTITSSNPFRFRNCWRA